MRRARQRSLIAAFAVLSVAVLSVPATSTASAAEPAGSAVSTARSAVPTSTEVIGSTTDGVLAVTDAYGLRRALLIAPDGRVLDLGRVRPEALPRLVPGAVWQPGDTGIWERRLLAGGPTQTISVPKESAVLAATYDALVVSTITAGGDRLDLLRSDAAPTPIHASADALTTVVASTGGVAFQELGGAGTIVRRWDGRALHEVARSTGQVIVLAVTDTATIWTERAAVLALVRSPHGDGPDVRSALPDTADEVVADDQVAAWATADDAGYALRSTRSSTPVLRLDGPALRLSGNQVAGTRRGDVVAADLQSGAISMVLDLPPFPPATVDAVALSDGRVAVVDDRQGDPRLVLSGRDAGSVLDVALSGTRTAVVASAGAGLIARVSDAVGPTREVTVPGPFSCGTRCTRYPRELSLSGSRLLVPAADGRELIDVDTGVRRSLPEIAALWGARLARQQGAAIVVEDLDGGQPPTVYDGLDGARRLLLAGDTLVALAGASATVVDLVTGARSTVGDVDATTAVLDPSGALAWRDASTGQIRLHAAGTTTTVAQGQPAEIGGPDRVVLAADDGQLVYVSGDDGSVRVLDIDVATLPVTVLSRRVPPVTTAWEPRFDLSRPAAWTLELQRDGESVIRRWSGTGTAVAPALQQTAAVPGAAYSWRLSTGSTALAAGTVRGARGVVAAVTAAGIASTASPTPAVRLRWSATGTGVRFDVAYRARREAGDGTWTSGPLTRLLTETGAATAVLPGQPGVTYLATVRAVAPDGALGPWSPAARTVMPFDALPGGPVRFVGKWERSTVKGAWLSTRITSRGNGATMSTTSTATTWVLLGSACATCGQAELLVDGRLVRRIDTAGSGYRAGVELARLKLDGRRHTVTVRSNDPRGRSLVLDAVVLTA